MLWRASKFCMRIILLTTLLAFAFSNALGQGFGSTVELVTVYSQNEVFYLKSWPFDSEFPSLRGVTKVFRKDSPNPIYTLSRGFDSVDDDSNNLIISNDGEVIFYLLLWGADEQKNGLKSISIYKHGELVQSYSASEITGCDLKKERCEIEYSNYEDVVDKEKSNWGSRNYKKTFKAGISDQEKFLSDYAFFSFDGIVYLTDSRKNVHQFSLKEAKYISSMSFTDIFDQIKVKGRFNKVLLQQYNAPTFLDFPKLQTGIETTNALAAVLRMKPAKNYGQNYDKYKNYSFKISGFLRRDGNFEIENLELFDNLPEKVIRDFFATKKFDTKAIPLPIDKWWIDDYFYFRKADIRLAIKERQDQIKEEGAALQKRLVAEGIEGRYIPKNLQEAFLELDKELSEINKKEMTALKSRKDMIAYHMGLGTWMRNNWGLWGGSRLQKYFTDKEVGHPEDMSSVILFFYWDWLQGNKDSWKDWEKNPKQKLF
jgi:hypothetical protein